MKDELAQFGIRADPLVVGNILERQVDSTEDLVNEGNKSVGLGDDDGNQAAFGRISMDQDLLDERDACQDFAFNVLCRNVLSLAQLVVWEKGMISKNCNGLQTRKENLVAKHSPVSEREYNIYLENVLLAVDDGDGTVRSDNTNISRMQPPFLVDGLLGLGLILEISRNDTWSTNTDLTTGMGPVGSKVVQLGDID